MTDSQLDAPDKDLSLTSVSTLVFDPGGSDVNDLDRDFTSDIAMLNTEHLAKYLSYLLMIYLVNNTTFLFFINSAIRTEGEERCLNLKPGGKITYFVFC